MSGEKQRDPERPEDVHDEVPIEDLRTKNVDELEAEHLKGGLRDFTFTKTTDKSSPSL